MKKNVGGIDRILRIVVGFGLVALTALGQVGAWGWLGVAVLATGVLGFCGAYPLLGISTCRVQQDSETAT